MPGSHFDRLDLSGESTVDCKTERMDWERAPKSRAAEVWDRAEFLDVGRGETARTVLVPNRLPQKKRHHEEDRRPSTDYRTTWSFIDIKTNRDGTRRQTLFAGGRLGL